MAYERKILHYSYNATTQLNDLSSRAEKATFSLLRQGGCGSGTLVLKDIWSLRNTIEVGHWIAFDFETGNRWYIGRVHTIEATTEDGMNVQLMGMSDQLSELYVGGFGYIGDDVPRIFAQTDLFPNDPDRAINTFHTMSEPSEIVQWLWNNRIQPNTHATASLIEPTGVTFESYTFRGEETITSIIRQLGILGNGASWGFDEQRRFYYTQKRTGVIATYKNGDSIRRMTRSSTRELLYNRMLLTGGYIYGSDILSGTAESWTGFWRYRATYHVPDSIAVHGERRIRLSLPWIRRNADSREFARQFFATYGGVTNRWTIETTRQSDLPRPWNGRFTLLDFDDTPLVTNLVDEMTVDFNEYPFFTITLGPEVPPYEDDANDQRWEIPNYDNPGDGEGDPPPPSIPWWSSSSGVTSLPPMSSLFSYESPPSDGPISSSGNPTSSTYTDDTDGPITSSSSGSTVTSTDDLTSSTGATSTNITSSESLTSDSDVSSSYPLTSSSDVSSSLLSSSLVSSSLEPYPGTLSLQQWNATAIISYRYKVNEWDDWTTNSETMGPGVSNEAAHTRSQVSTGVSWTLENSSPYHPHTAAINQGQLTKRIVLSNLGLDIDAWLASQASGGAWYAYEFLSLDGFDFSFQRGWSSMEMGTSLVRWTEAYLTTDASAPTGTNQASLTGDISPDMGGGYEYALTQATTPTLDLWGSSITKSQMAASGFGVILKAEYISFTPT